MENRLLTFCWFDKNFSIWSGPTVHLFKANVCEDKTNTPHPVISHSAPSATSATSTTLDWGKPTRCKHVFFQGSKIVGKQLKGGNMVAIALLSCTATIFESALYVTSVFSVLQKREQILRLNYFLISFTEKKMKISYLDEKLWTMLLLNPPCCEMFAFGKLSIHPTHSISRSL